MEITKEIKELIQKQLPGLHANALKDFIQEAEKLKEVHEELKHLVTKQKQEITILQADIIEKKAQFDKVKEILTREEKLYIERIEFDKNVYRFEIDKKLEAFKVEAANQRANDAVTIATLLVKNPVLSENFFESKYKPSSYTNNSDGTTTYHNAGDIIEERRQSKEYTKKGPNDL